MAFNTSILLYSSGKNVEVGTFTTTLTVTFASYTPYVSMLKRKKHSLPIVDNEVL